MLSSFNHLYVATQARCWMLVVATSANRTQKIMDHDLAATIVYKSLKVHSRLATLNKERKEIVIFIFPHSEFLKTEVNETKLDPFQKKFMLLISIPWMHFLLFIFTFLRILDLLGSSEKKEEKLGMPNS